MSTLGIERFRGERGGAMEKGRSPFLRWTEETERGPSVKARVSDCQPRWRIRIPLLAGAASRATENLTQ